MNISYREDANANKRFHFLLHFSDNVNEKKNIFKEWIFRVADLD